jgi:hypothetical protein
MSSPEFNRWPRLKYAVIFQIKLGMDAVRDLILSPVSILCAVLDFLLGNSRKEGYFQKLMYFGRKTDKWINLFGEHDKRKNILVDASQKIEVNADQIFIKIEALLKEQHEKGGLSLTAKSSIDRYLNKLIKKEEVVEKPSPSSTE